MIIGLSGQAGCGKDTVADFLVEHHGFVKIALADPIKRAAMQWWDFTEQQLWGPSEMRNKPDERYPIPHDWVETESEIRDHMQLSCSRCPRKIIHPGDDGFPLGTVGDLKDMSGVCFHLTPRHALQQIGTEVARAIDPDVWVRLTMKIANELLNSVEPVRYTRVNGLAPRVSGFAEYKGVVISDCRFVNEFVAIKKEGKLVRIKRGQLRIVDDDGETVVDDPLGLNAQQKQHRSETEQKEFKDDDFDYLIGNTGDLMFLQALTTRMLDVFKGKIRKYDAAQKDIPPFMRK